MAIQIETSTQKMRGSADEVSQVATQFNQLQKSMFEAGRELDKTWEGDASQSFDNQLKTDEPGFEKLFMIMNEYADAIKESANEYDRTEAKIQEQIATKR